MTMYKIQTITAGSAVASLDFTVPSGYDDLLLVISARLDFGAAQASMGLVLNTAAGDTSYRWLRGNGSAGLAGADSGRSDFYYGEAPASNATANTFGSFQVYIANYRGTQQKSMSAEGVSENNSTTAFQYISAGLCTKTAAITSLSVRGFLGGSGNLVAGSSATLYGIKNATSMAKATGGQIQLINGYWYHTFTASGTFTPTTTLNCDILVVAGGGGGGRTANSAGGASGGGGAGGYLAFASQTVSSATTVTVGAGGPGASNTNGSDSQFGSLTLVKGGGFGSYHVSANTYTVGSGGSGGGAGGEGSVGVGPGTGTSGQGNSGGTRAAVNYSAGGGGGADAAGGNSTAGFTGGVGGAGKQWLNGSYYAGGGGGNTQNGGIGGGGKGEAWQGGNGTANTGGGGGGSTRGSGMDPAYGGAGGSGVVIVRYPA